MANAYGYTGKIARIDLSSGSVSTLKPSKEVYRKYLGGWAMGMNYLLREGLADPMGPENMLQLLVGSVTGIPRMPEQPS